MRSFHMLLVVAPLLFVPTFSSMAAKDGEACGGPDRIKCDDRLWCMHDEGQCGEYKAKGVCTDPRPCWGVVMCGCNGITYSALCQLYQYTQIRHYGPV
jgi:hypothetical protein